jgi:hypothetical protein
MPPKKKIEGIRRFRDGSSNYWVEGKHYYMTEDGEVHFGAGGFEEQHLIDELKAFIKRNKHKYVAQVPLVQKSFLEELTKGKFKGKTVEEVFAIEKKYLEWMLANYSFSAAEENLKKEITEILKK